VVRGHYTAHVAPGTHSTDGVSLQPAVVRASRPGYYEKDLCRAGNLGMAFKRPESTRTDRFVAIVYPGHPYRLDFTMLPAARLHGQLVDPEKRNGLRPARASRRAGRKWRSGHGERHSARGPVKPPHELSNPSQLIEDLLRFLYRAPLLQKERQVDSAPVTSREVKKKHV